MIAFIIAPMASPPTGPSVNFSAAQPADIDTDFLFMPVFDQERISELIPGLDAATGGTVGRALSSGPIDFGGWPRRQA